MLARLLSVAEFYNSAFPPATHPDRPSGGRGAQMSLAGGYAVRPRGDATFPESGFIRLTAAPEVITRPLAA